MAGPGCRPASPEGIRADNAKLNLAPRPAEAVWLQLRSITLPNGDHVQAVARWRPAKPFADISLFESADIAEQVGSPRDDGERWSVRPQDTERYAADLIATLADCSVQKARGILDGFISSQALCVVDYYSPKQRKHRKGLQHNPETIADIRRQAQEDSKP